MFLDIAGRGDPRLLGIDWGHINDWTPVCNDIGRPLNPARPRDQQVKVNTGMMVVVPAWKLTEILESEKFVEGRSVASEKMRKEEAERPSPISTQD